MTDRVQSLTVFFDKEIRDDDAQVYIDSIRMMRGVSNVELGPVMDMNAYSARETIACKLWDDIRELLIGHRSKT